MTENLRILLYPRNGIMFGQCLEHDVCIRGTDSDDVRRRLMLVIGAYEDEGADFFSLPPAPRAFFDTWQSSVEPPVRQIVHINPLSVAGHTVAIDFVEAVAA